MNTSTKAIAVAIVGGLSLSAIARPAAAQDQDKPPAQAESPASTEPAPPPPPPASAPPAVSAPGDNGVSVGTEVGAPPAMGGPSPNAKPAVQELPGWMRGVTLGAGVLLWYYQPIVPRTQGVENNVSVFWSHLLIDGQWGPFSLHIEPRFRDLPLRTITTSVNGATLVSYTQDNGVWLQEAYAALDSDDGVKLHLKLGKEYSHFGYFWDGSFYGNIQVYDGLKLDPDYGASFEGELGKSDDVFGLGWWAQYFVVDGSTNVSLPGRDTISVPGARRRNQTIARLEPRLRLGAADLTLGVSGEYVQADIPSIGPQNVWRGAVDASVAIAGLKVLGEIQHQDGRSVTDFPFPSTAAGPGSSKNIDYAQIGGEYTLGAFTARYYLSLGSYNDAPLPTGGSATVKQWLHVAGLGFAASPNVSLLGELVFWENDTPTSSTLYDRSFNLTLYAHL
jgi:hypothetical protein